MPMGYLCTLSGNCDSLHCHCTLKITNNISAFEEIDEEQQEAPLELQDDEQFVPAFEMEDAADSDHAEESD